MEEISACDLLEVASVKIDSVEMLVIWVLICIFTITGEIHDTNFFVNFENPLYMPCTFCESVLQISLIVISIKMGPSVSFAPLDKFFAIFYCGERTSLLICVHPLLDDRDERILTDGV